MLIRLFLFLFINLKYNCVPICVFILSTNQYQIAYSKGESKKVTYRFFGTYTYMAYII